MKLNEIRRKLLSDLGESSDLTLFEGKVGETPCLYAAFEALLDKELLESGVIRPLAQYQGEKKPLAEATYAVAPVKKTKSLSEAAEELGTDTETLHHYFQKRLGIDFRTWRTRLRLEDAMQLLLEEPESPVSMISRRCGFSDRSNFSRQFLFHTGMTPAKWRKEAGKSHDIPAPENDYV